MTEYLLYRTPHGIENHRSFQAGYTHIALEQKVENIKSSMLSEQSI